MRTPKRYPTRRIALAVATAAALAGPIVLASPPRASAASKPATGSPCSFTAGVYSAGESVIKACGGSVFPLRSVKPLADGGRSYVYNVGGDEVTFNVPPPGFNALKASARQVQEYSLPTRQTLGSQWTAVMRKLHIVTPPPYLVMLNGYATSSNWSGNVANGHTYTSVFGAWIEPTGHTNTCGSGGEGTWVGLGGWNSGNLAQDGTAIGGPIYSHEAWWEILPAGPVALNLYATAGQEFLASTTRTSVNGQAGYRFFLSNSYTGATLNPFVASSRYDGSSAEMITEKPGTYLAKFDNFTIELVQAVSGGTTKNIETWPHFGVTLVDGGGNTMAYPGPIGSNGSWIEYYVRCN